eukprot:scaffold9526_cov247-Amphora_coffeaeformis.AAC.6
MTPRDVRALQKQYQQEKARADACQEKMARIDDYHQLQYLRNQVVKLQNELQHERQTNACLGSILQEKDVPTNFKQSHPLVKLLSLQSSSMTSATTPLQDKVDKVEQELVTERALSAAGLDEKAQVVHQHRTTTNNNNKKNSGTKSFSGDPIAHVLQLQRERDAERHENFFLRRQLMHLRQQNTTHHGRPMNDPTAASGKSVGHTTTMLATTLEKNKCSRRVVADILSSRASHHHHHHHHHHATALM